MIFSFIAIVASREYHVYKETSWSNAKLNDEVKVELEPDVKSLSNDPYACVLYKQGIPTSSVGKTWDIFHEKSLAMFISSSLIDIFVQRKMGCRYHGGIHSKFLHFRI